MSQRTIFKHEDGIVPNIVAIGYSVFGYACAIAMLTADHALWNAAGVLLLAHTLVVGAYLIHELTHGSIFKSARHAILLGRILLWLNGSIYSTFRDLQRVHLRHHATHADVLVFDIRAFLDAHPALRWVTLALEWAYIPVVDVIMRCTVIARPFRRGAPAAPRVRMIVLVTSRLAFFALLGALSPRTIPLHFVGFGLFLHVLRFLDAHQHTYETFRADASEAIPSLPRRDRAYEEANTYSNLLSERFPWLNLLVLHFAYHNAHHVKPAEPWYRLPALHASLYREGRCDRILPARELIAGYCRDRIRRIRSSDLGEVAPAGPNRAEHFVGAIAVSFLY